MSDSTKPYLLRAIYEWCTDNGYTPYLATMVDAATLVPKEFVKNGEIVLNISFNATTGLKMENEYIYFSARFGGVSRAIEVPVSNVLAIYARENGQGMAFEVDRSTGAATKKKPAVKNEESAGKRPATLSAVPTAEAPASSASQGDDDPEPPKKGGPAKLTRIK